MGALGFIIAEHTLTDIQKTARLVDKSGGSNNPRGAYDLLRRGQGTLGEGGQKLTFLI